ncbi:hypothetical protein [Dyadobacter sp. NIV53]|uniref:hypothetical protein n=1 Tax=Dyadobacter sp. NIV53 TaxID=2861765 RepID=UPI001C886539|nr:hypothetical protein [Dyadobacter sp. NIV53]
MSESNILKREFNYLTKTSEANAILSSLRLYITVDQNQPFNSAGLAFEVTLVNEANESKTIRNILDTVQIKLQDEEGWPLKLPVGSPPRILINSPAKIEYPFLIDSFRSVSGNFNLTDKIDESEFTIEGNASYNYNFRIDRIQDIPREKFQETTTKTKTLNKGKYKIDVLIDILSQESIGHKLCESGPIEISFN